MRYTWKKIRAMNKGPFADQDLIGCTMESAPMSQKRFRDPESAGCGYGSEALLRVWSIIFLVYLTLLIMHPFGAGLQRVST